MYESRTPPPEPVEPVEPARPYSAAPHSHSVEPVAPVTPAYGRPAYNYRAVQAVWLIASLIDALIAIRFALKLTGASTASSFVTFMYGITDPLVAPFQGIFANNVHSSYVFEPGDLVAIAIYALIGWALVMLIRIMTAPRGTRPVVD